MPDAKSIFLEAIEKPLDQRVPYIESVCDDNVQLCQKVFELTRFFESNSDSILDTQDIREAIGDDQGEVEPLISGVLPHFPRTLTRRISGSEATKYLLLSVKAQKKQEVIYRSIQVQPVRRHVTLKVLERVHGQAEFDRLKEAQCTAMKLSHPFIASIFDAGISEEHGPFLAMESFDGIPITDYCEQHELSISERLRLFLEVCRGIQFMHDNGCIYRDLQPSNVVIVIHDGILTPKIVEFGVAVSLEHSNKELIHLTETRDQHEFPAYKSPEQIRLRDREISITSDIYSLGVLLYELIAGFPMFHQNQLAEISYAEQLRFLRDVAPKPPSLRIGSQRLSHLACCSSWTTRRTNSWVKGALDSVTMKCLRKNASERYQSVAMLMREVDLALNGAPSASSFAFRLDPLIRFLKRFKNRHGKQGGKSKS